MKAKYERHKEKTSASVSVTDYRDLANLPHWHTEHEIVCVVFGSVEIMINNSLYRLGKGESFFVESEAIHYIHSSSGSVVRVIKLDSQLLRSVAEKYMLPSPIIEISCPVMAISSEIKEELEQRQLNWNVIADSKALELGALIFRKGKAVKKEAPVNGADKKYKELLRLISERYQFLTFEEAAEFMCLSQPYFSKYFHRMSGMPFTRYLNIVKVSVALEMLSAGEMSVTEIADSCGFSTIRSFNRVFKELTGTIPTKARGESVIIRDVLSDGGFDPTLSCTVMLSVEDIAVIPDYAK